ncbi:MAG: triose-phosphate isomerase [Bacteroidales bacterium]|nr:triose-phosphate isomerase [Bacteroidales bacterium]
MRKQIVAGNWKMNKNLQEGIALAKAINEYFTNKPAEKADVILCTPFIHLSSMAGIINAKRLSFGAQNCASEVSGAYTGEVSADMIKSTGAEYVILGHSERRSYYHEDNALLNKKTVLALQTGLKVIFCCGEVKEERVAEKHFDVVKVQLEEGILNLPAEDMKNIVIAYEPVWAIGTGLTATPDQAQEMHNFIRSLVEKHYGKKVANDMTILYGGSCKPSNAKEIFSKPDVDGGLIGGAALKAEDFSAIVEAF